MASTVLNSIQKNTTGRIQVELEFPSTPLWPQEAVQKISKIEGNVDVYCFYEGTQGLSQSGAAFMKEMFKSLTESKKDAKLWLYSLREWDFYRPLSKMSTSTPLGEAINKINKTILECIYSSSFFTFCRNVDRNSLLYKFVNSELVNKERLLSLSSTIKDLKGGSVKNCSSGKQSPQTVGELFENRPSLFDCIENMDLKSAYSLMQYIEGYYLIRQSVEAKLFKGEKNIQITFLLPNDEGKYYLDFPTDIEKFLQLEFKEELVGRNIDVSFIFFRYGENLAARPYIEKNRKIKKISVSSIGSYFDFLNRIPLIVQENLNPSFLRDQTQNVNQGY